MIVSPEIKGCAKIIRQFAEGGKLQAFITLFIPAIYGGIGYGGGGGTEALLW